MKDSGPLEGLGRQWGQAGSFHQPHENKPFPYFGLWILFILDGPQCPSCLANPIAALKMKLHGIQVAPVTV